jgi:hypothetical protein
MLYKGAEQMRERLQAIKWGSFQLLSLPVLIFLSTFLPFREVSVLERITGCFIFVAICFILILIFSACIIDLSEYSNKFQQEFDNAVNECNQNLPLSTLSKVSGYWKVIPYLESRYVPQRHLNKIQNEMRESFNRVVGVLSDEVVVNVLCKGDAPELRSEMVDYVNDFIKSEKKNMVDIRSRFKKIEKESIQEHKRRQKIRKNKNKIERIKKKETEAARNEARSRQTAVLADKMLNEVYLNKGE